MSRVDTPASTARLPVGLRAMRLGLSVASALSVDGAATLALRMFTSPRRRARPERERGWLAGARPLALPFRQASLAAWEWGERGPRVLLVHGWEGRGAQLADHADGLVRLGFRVVTFDAPAHGDSGGDRATFFDFAEAIQVAAATLGPLHAIVAHSMGGASTLWAARERPLAERYVMIAPPSDLRDFIAEFGDFMALSPEVRRRMHERIEAEYQVDLDDVRTERAALEQTAPVLVVHDIADRVVPFERGRAMADAWPGARFIRTDGLGHKRILRDAEVIAHVARFVAL